MRIDVVTLFPDFFQGPLHFGILERAIRQRRLEVHLHDLRNFTTDRHRTVDDRPFGGGEGMVLKPEPLFACVESLGVEAKAVRDAHRESVTLLSAAGTRFSQAVAREMAGLHRLILLCGRYEGVDERVTEGLCDREISIGDFVLSGGELGAAVVIDAVARLLPGVLGHADSALHESFGVAEDDVPSRLMDPSRSTYASGGLLDYPQYTRPPVFRGAAVPQVLTGGDHASVRSWRRRASLVRTLRNRPDLLETMTLSAADRKLLEQMREEAQEECGDVPTDVGFGEF